MNSSGLGTLLNNFEIDEDNFTDFRIIGFEESSEAYFKDKDLYDRNHWLYDQCNNKSDAEGIGYLPYYSEFSAPKNF